MECIAEQSFLCHPPTGAPFTLIARFGKPETVEPSKGSRYAHGVCLISFEPLVAERQCAGANQFQALCLALEHLRTVMKVFVGEGGRIYYEGTDSLIDLSSSWFGPFPGRKQLGGSWWQGLPNVGEPPESLAQ